MVIIQPSLRLPAAVIIPSYKVEKTIVGVIDSIGAEVEAIYVVDDLCPNDTAGVVERAVTDPRVRIIRNHVNQGVGGATLEGMRIACADGYKLLIKIDGDGQMDPAMIPTFLQTVSSGMADVSKGNRFFEFEGLQTMPKLRLFGNAGLSFLSKMSTGYWDVFDPTNGFICIHADVFNLLPLDKIEKRYFFESDLLFRLSLTGARVVDVPMHAYYGDEVSSLSALREFMPFLRNNARNAIKRILYCYFMRDFNIGSLSLVLGIFLLIFGICFGLSEWGWDEPATAGTVMIAALPLILGFQFLIGFLTVDIKSAPASALHQRLAPAVAIRRSMKHRGWQRILEDNKNGAIKQGAEGPKT
jgi:glycosyltransferase involved in cell wall biosynthesis